MDSGGIYTSMGSTMLGLEMSLNPNIPQNPHPIQQQQPPPNPHLSGGFGLHQEIEQTRQPGFQQYSSKPKNQSNLTLSDDEHDDHTAENSADDSKRKMSPWQRMKWTDNMVRLLIMVVYYIGDNEGGPEVNDPSGKKKGSGVLQKKGKWKSVSRAMMERGFYVSPQQCEDKFNDLNKRYKRVNDIIGKGTACKVVENQGLLETMDHIPPKLKEEVKKLLNSKHLFFREMCAYHNSCGHGNGGTGSAIGIGNGGGGVQHSPDVSAEPSQAQQQLQQQRRCNHSSGHTSMGPNFGRSEAETSKMVKGVSLDEEDDVDDSDDDSDDDEDDDVVEGGVRSHEHDYGNEDRSSRKRQKKGVNAMSCSPAIQPFSSELMNVLQDGSKSPAEKREWMRTRMVQLDEQHLSYQTHAFELAKQKLKWEKFCSKKEREMERGRLANERMKLENERMVLLIRQKELEFNDIHHKHSKSDPSIVTG